MYPRLILFSLFVGFSYAAVITEAPGGAGNTIGTAQVIPAGSFTSPSPANVFPHAVNTLTITGGRASSLDVDIYQFDVPVQRSYIFDVDNSPFTFDTILSLFNSAGTLIAYDDDSGPADPGTASALDSFLGVIELAPGTYYIALTQFANFPTQDNSAGQITLFRPDGAFGGRLTPNAAVGISTFDSSTVDTDNSGLAYSLP